MFLPELSDKLSDVYIASIGHLGLAVGNVRRVRRFSPPLPTQYIKETYLIITIGPLETNYSENFNPNYNTFHSRNFFGKDISKMSSHSSISLWPPYIIHANFRDHSVYALSVMPSLIGWAHTQNDP